MHRARAPRLFALLFTAFLAGCDGSRDREAGGATPGVVGTWTSDPSPSQLGRAVHRYDIRADGTYHASLRLVDAGLPPMEVSGTWDAGRRVLHGAKPGDEMTYAFEGEVLVLREKNGDSYRLKRQGR
jgi:hypothetical protein